MSDDPARLVDSLDASSELREALALARTYRPTSRSVDGLVGRVLIGFDLPVDGGGGGDSGGPDGGGDGGPSGGEGSPDGTAGGGAEGLDAVGRTIADPSLVAHVASGITVSKVGAVVAAGAVVAVGALVVGAAMMASSPPEPEQNNLTPSSEVNAAVVASANPRPAPSGLETGGSPSPSTAASVLAAPPATPVSVGAPKASVDVPSSEVGSTVAADEPPSVSETELLGRAQGALATDPSATLRHCAEHAKLYPGGTLSQEREVLIIEALVRLGRVPEAKARAEAFRAAFPGSGHLRRLDVLVGP